MKDYNANNIKNVAVVGHGGSGKTSLVEAMLFKAGCTDRLGKVADGNTVSDYDTEEIKRKASLSLSINPVEFQNTKINLLDTPGLFDFALGMSEGIRAAGSVLIAVSGKSGVTVGAKKAYKMAEKMQKSRMIFVTKMDQEHADFYKVLEGLKASFGPSICPLVVPFVQDSKVQCYIDLVEMKAYTYDNGSRKEVPMPDSEHRIEGLVTAISEAVAETDEVLFDKYFSGEKYTHEEMIQGIHKGIFDGTITPVFCGSSFTMEGVDLLMEDMVEMLPSAGEKGGEEGISGDDIVEVPCDENGAPVAYVFKTIADPFVGKLSYVKVISGKLAPDTELINMTTGQSEKIGKLLYVRGKKQEEIKQIKAGDICAISKLSANTGDTLCSPKRPVSLTKTEFPLPCYSMAIKPVGKGDESKISQGITRLLEEDPTLSFIIDKETHEQVLSGLGEQHLDVTVAKLKSKFGVDVILEPPTVAYRETIRKKVKVQGKHKKQSGGHGQYGDVWIEFEPCDGEEMVFEEKVFGGAVPRNFFPAVEKGLRDCVKHGTLAGYPVVGLKAILVDGSYHPVDSSEMSFKMAATLAYKAGLPQASPIILEPIGKLSVFVPDNTTGDMMGELNKRRGRVLGMNAAEDGMTEIEAEAPMSEMQDFATLVRQMTQGSGNFTFVFQRYDPLPSNLEAAVIENSKAKEE